MALQHQTAPVGGGEAPGGRETVLQGEGAAGEPLELPVVGGEQGGGGAGIQNIYMPGQGVYAVGIQHHGTGEVPEQSAGQLAGGGVSAQAGADDGRTAALGPGEKFLIAVGYGEGHGLAALDGHDGIDLVRHSQKHQPGPGADGGPGGEHRGPGEAHAAAQQKQLAEVPLVGRPGTAGEGVRPFHRPQIPAREQGGGEAVGQTDVNDPHLTGVHPALVQIQPGLGGGEGDGHVRPHGLA